jgi:hypothetical protein
MRLIAIATALALLWALAIPPYGHAQGRCCAEQGDTTRCVPCQVERIIP